MSTRNYFSYTVVKAVPALNAAGDAVLTSLTGITWNAYSLSAAGSPSTVTVFDARSGGNETSGGVTAYNGVIEFWADPGEYKISISDPSSRIGDQDIFWSSVSGQEGGIPGTKISNDNALISNQIQDGAIATVDIGDSQVTNAKLSSTAVTSSKIVNGTIATADIGDSQITNAKLADEVSRQLIPIGAVIDWWRPDSSISVPSGFVVCSGGTITSGNHDFGTGASITVPDLRNKFILGASTAITEGVAATAGAAGASEADPTNAPGISGKGGTNGVRDLTHTHSVPAHLHAASGATITIASGTAGTPAGSVNTLTAAYDADGIQRTFYVTTDANNGTSAGTVVGAGWTSGEPKFPKYVGGGAASYSTFTGSELANHGHAGSTITGNVGAGVNGDAAMVTGAASANITAVHDFRPSYYGLLKIMKVKRS